MQYKSLDSSNQPHFDIRVYKKELRTKYRNIRCNITGDIKNEKDNNIFLNVCALPEYTVCTTVLCFVSTPEEIDTHRFIEKCLQDGKRVAVPYCIEDSRDMLFFYINSISDLKPRTFGLLEPIVGLHEEVVDFSDSICIVPGLAFDYFGYRIGYGGGYYDRFLSRKYNGILKIGVCYADCLLKRLKHGRYDVPSDYIVCENNIIKRAF